MQAWIIIGLDYATLSFLPVAIPARCWAAISLQAQQGHLGATQTMACLCRITKSQQAMMAQLNFAITCGPFEGLMDA